MKITKIESQVKTSGRYSVFVDDKFAFGISEFGLIDSEIRVGKALSKDDLDKYKEEAKTDKLYNMVLGLIARRPRSIWEVKEYLKRKGLPVDGVESIVHGLTYKGFLDDLDFAGRWVENRRLLKPTSKRKLTLELRQKHVSDEIIKTVLAEDGANEVEILKAEIERKRRQTRYQDNTKLMQYLARQGYRYDDIKQALRTD